MATNRTKYVIEADTKGMGKAKTQTKGLGNSMGSLAGAFTGVGAAMAAVAIGMAVLNKAIDLSIAAAKKMVKDFNESEKSLKKLRGVLKSTGHVAGTTEAAMIQLADSLSQVTMFSDEQIESAEAMILTFTNIGGEVIPRATEAILDMASFMDEDLKAASIRLGKALDDPKKGITALADVGTTFTEEEREMINTMVDAGNVMDAQNVILGSLERQYGGTAKAMGETLAGQVTILNNEISDLSAAMGEAIMSSEFFGDSVGFIVDMFSTLTRGVKIHNFTVLKGSDAWDKMSIHAKVSTQSQLLDLQKLELEMMKSPTWANIAAESWDEVTLALLRGIPAWAVAESGYKGLRAQLEFVGIDLGKLSSDYEMTEEDHENLRQMLAKEVGINVDQKAIDDLIKLIKQGQLELDELNKLLSLETEQKADLTQKEKLIALTNDHAEAKKSEAESLKLVNLELEKEQMMLSGEWFEEAHGIRKQAIRDEIQGLRDLGVVKTESLIKDIEVADSAIQGVELTQEQTETAKMLEEQLAAEQKAWSLKIKMQEAAIGVGLQQIDASKTMAKAAQDAAQDVIYSYLREALAGFIKDNVKWFSWIPFPGNLVAIAAATAAASTGFEQMWSKASKLKLGAQTGFEGVVDEPTTFTVGEGGAAEYVSVTPMEGVNNAGGKGITINITGNVMSEEFVEGELASKVQEAIRKGVDFGMS